MLTFSGIARSGNSQPYLSFDIKDKKEIMLGSESYVISYLLIHKHIYLSFLINVHLNMFLIQNKTHLNFDLRILLK